MQRHGTAIARDGRAVLLLGESGSGKSDLALRLLDRGWRLIGDDQVILNLEDGVPHVSGDPRLANTLEVRGLGLVGVETMTDALPLNLVVELGVEVPRLPECDHFEFFQHQIPLIRLNAFEMSSVIKLEYAHEAPSRIGRTSLGI